MAVRSFASIEFGYVEQVPQLVLSRDNASSTKCVQADNSLEHAGQEDARRVNTCVDWPWIFRVSARLGV